MADNTQNKLEAWLGKNNHIGIDIWHKKYRYGNESFDDWIDRVSGGDEDIAQLIREKKFLFAGRILSNRGVYKDGKKVTYSNCYVIPAPEDSLESIFDCAKNLARTFSYGGGCGIDISKLSPKGAKINNAANETSGAVSFMDLYSLTTELIGQNGRRGALMISISCDHPDVEEFIEIKSDLDKITKANLSIRVTDKFMRAVQHDETYKLTFTREETGEKIEREVKAKEIFDKFCYMNWDYAEPAFLFWDTINSYNLLSEDENFEYAGVNPCAEEPLPSGGSCLLGSLNLAEFVKDGAFDFSGFNEAVSVAIKGLNEVLDEGLALHPLSVQRESVRDWRQIGLGIMGLADMLIKLKMKYGSQESINLCDEIGWNMANTAIYQSMMLARVDGAYPKFNEKVYDSKFYMEHIGVEEPLRNSQLLTIAPTGTLSTMLGVSGGIEPIFANYYTRKTESLHGEDKEYKIFTPIAWEYLQSNGYGEDESMLPNYFITSSEIPYRNRIEMQAIWQRHIDASISSTVNLPNSATVEDIADLYMYAWKLKLKGITIFRDGCKRLGILTTDNDNANEIDDDELSITSLPRGVIEEVSDDLISAKRTIVNGCGKMYLHLDFDENTGQPLETFLECGSGGGCERNLTFISRLMSLALRGGVPIEAIIDQAFSVKPCKAYCDRRKKFNDTSKGNSCPQAIGYALVELNKKIQDRCFADDDEEEIATKINDAESTIQYECPECGRELTFEGGCVICHSCGWSRCE